MRTPHEAIRQLHGMSSEIMQARSWLRAVSAGEMGIEGPYFSPCKAKGQGGGGIQNHPLFQELLNDDTDYQALLAMRVTNRPNELAQLRSFVNKYQQSMRDLLKSRESIAEQTCKRDDEFTKRERAYKQQVATLTQNVLGYRKTAESNKSAAQGTMATLAEIQAERDG